MSKSIIVITGASSGIGAAMTRQMDKGFQNVDEFWLIGRRQNALEKVASCLGHSSRILPMDICDREAMEALQRRMEREKVCIRILVNSAGFGIMGAFAERTREEETDMVRLNCQALVHMTHMCIPYMKRGSRIIQLASSAAFMPQPDFAVYAASKAFVLSFSRALGEELWERGIYVTSVCPGPVDTPFFDIAEKNGDTLACKKLLMADPHAVAARALRDAFLKKHKSVYSPWIRGFDFLTKVLPHQTLLEGMKLLKRMEARGERG